LTFEALEALVLVGQQFYALSPANLYCKCELVCILLSVIQFQRTWLPKTSARTTNEHYHSTTPESVGYSPQHNETITLHTQHTLCVVRSQSSENSVGPTEIVSYVVA